MAEMPRALWCQFGMPVFVDFALWQSQYVEEQLNHSNSCVKWGYWKKISLFHLEEAFILLTMGLGDVIQKKWAWCDQETPWWTLVCMITESSSLRKAYYTQWSKSEREKQILYINTYVWNLERWPWWTCLQQWRFRHERTNLGTQWGKGVQFSSVPLLSCGQLFVTSWIAARQASLSITNSRSLLKLMSIESVMPTKHLILCHPLLLLSSSFPSIRVFSNRVISSHQVAKVLELQLQHQSFRWILDPMDVGSPCSPRESQESSPTPQGRGESRMSSESSMETYSSPCVKQPASGNLPYDSGSSNQVLCANLEGCDAVGDRRGVQEGGNTCIPMSDSCWHMAETEIILSNK